MQRQHSFKNRISKAIIFTSDFILLDLGKIDLRFKTKLTKTKLETKTTFEKTNMFVQSWAKMIYK